MLEKEPFAVVIKEPPQNNEMLREFLQTIGITLSKKPKGAPFPLHVHPEVMAEKSVQQILMPHLDDAYIVGSVPY